MRQVDEIRPVLRQGPLDHQQLPEEIGAGFSLQRPGHNLIKLPVPGSGDTRVFSHVSP